MWWLLSFLLVWHAEGFAGTWRVSYDSYNECRGSVVHVHVHVHSEDSVVKVVRPVHFMSAMPVWVDKLSLEVKKTGYHLRHESSSLVAQVSEMSWVSLLHRNSNEKGTAVVVGVYPLRDDKMKVILYPRREIVLDRTDQYEAVCKASMSTPVSQVLFSAVVLHVIDKVSDAIVSDVCKYVHDTLIRVLGY